MTPDTDLAEYIETVLTEVCFGREDSYPLQVTIDRYFAPDYKQRTDGELGDRKEFADHIEALRALVATGTIEVLETLRVGHRIAGRHRVTVTKRDGTTSQLEVYLLGELAKDGRLRRVDEISRVIAGGEADSVLARTR